MVGEATTKRNLGDVGAQQLANLFELLPRLDWSPEQRLDHQRAALRATLEHARSRSRWHRHRLEGIDLDAVTPTDLAALPVMTKRELMDAWDAVVTDDRLDLATARAHLARVDAEGLSLLHDEYLVFQTGGSTGEPGVFVWHADEMSRWGASVIRWSAAAGLAPPRRTAWVAARSARHPSAAVTILQGADPALTVPVDQPVAAIVERLNALQADQVMVVASMLVPLVDAARRGELDIHPERLGIFGDVAAPGAVEEAAAVFGVRPTEGYPTTDVGHIGQQAPDERGIYLNEDLLLVECVDADEQPVPAGVLCDHLLVTSLHQRTLPMIRYRVDDRVIVDPEPGKRPAFRRLLAIDGRSDDQFRYGDVTVHPHAIRSVLSGHLGIRDHQVRQTATGVAVELVTATPGDLDAIAAELDAALRRAGLPDPEVTVETVARLPHTAVGKRRHFVPLERGAPG